MKYGSPSHFLSLEAQCKGHAWGHDLGELDYLLNPISALLYEYDYEE